MEVFRKTLGTLYPTLPPVSAKVTGGILGIDNSLSSIGWCLIDATTREVEVGCFQPVEPRVYNIHSYMGQLMRHRFAPSHIFIEDFTFQTSFSSTQVAIGFGATMSGLQRADVELESKSTLTMVHPSRVKNVVGEKKGEKKAKSKEFMLNFFPNVWEGKRVSQRIQGDVSDAFAIAYLGLLTEWCVSGYVYGSTPEYVFKGDRSLMKLRMPLCLQF